MNCDNKCIDTMICNPSASDDETTSNNKCKLKNVSFSTIVTIIEYQTLSEVFSFSSIDNDDSIKSINLFLGEKANEIIDQNSSLYNLESLDDCLENNNVVMVLKNINETVYKESNEYNPLYDMKLQMKIRKNNKYHSKKKVLPTKSHESGCSVKSIFGKILNWM